jgi:hypothetical protein
VFFLPRLGPKLLRVPFRATGVEASKAWPLDREIAVRSGRTPPRPRGKAPVES